MLTGGKGGKVVVVRKKNEVCPIYLISQCGERWSRSMIALWTCGGIGVVDVVLFREGPGEIDARLTRP